MTAFNFSKYQGTGNDFIMIDDRDENFPYQHHHKTSFDTTIIANLCERRFGIGADGLILIRNHSNYDFEVIYFNADGSQSLCGNGSRCAVLFAHNLGMVANTTHFLAIDGAHEAKIEEELIHLKMGNVSELVHHGEEVFLDTGSPHFIQFVEAIDQFDVVNEGRKVRYDDRFQPGGTNVNFVEECGENELFVRTYERGVENETLSCGTGVTAASLAASLKGYRSPVKIKTKGGGLFVSFRSTGEGTFEDIHLIGPAGMVFEGMFKLAD